MKPTRLCLLACVAPFLALAAAARGQVVFFDDFDGDALLPHWGLPRPEDWEYNVSNSMLNVTGLFYPSSPDQPSNGADLSASFASQTDFRIDARMGWEAGQNPHWLGLQMLGPGAAHVAQIGYRNDLSLDRTPVIFGGASGAAFTIPAPPPGNYDFMITRTGAQFDFFFEGSLVASLPDLTRTPIGAIEFGFVGPYPGPFGTLHIDRVRIVPAPGTLPLVVSIAVVFALGRTRLTTTEAVAPSETTATQQSRGAR